jgi:hypothetical protein
MRLTQAALLALTLAGFGCAWLPDDPDESRLVCRSDAECSEGQVCFADGCGDPGQNIVVEVTPNPRAGLHAQDFTVENLRPSQNLELFGPATLQGQVRRQTLLADPNNSTTAYSGSVSVRASGESLLIPGVVRRYEGTLVPDNGSYQLPVGAGSFSVTLLAADPEIPPLTQARTVEPGQAALLDFLLPAPTSLTRLAGKVVRLPGVLVDTDLEVQALDEKLNPLSQRVPVVRGTGEFLLALLPSAGKLENVLVQVTTLRSSEELVPQKTFSVDPRPGVTAPLELGDYGEPVTVQGRVVDRDGKPVAGASVYLQGKVGGGGQFRSRSVLTGPDGRFELRSLPSHPDTPLTLYAVPLPESSAGITVQSTAIPRGGVTLKDVVCPDKIVVQGTLERPEGLPAAGVRVVAEPVGAVTGWPRPAVGAEAESATDEDGIYRLRLDPGEYRFDFIPSENLPRVSRFVTVLPAMNLELASFTLSKGRRITGLVTLSDPELRGPTPGVPYAAIRFFRVVNVEGEPTAVMLAQTVADSSGNYTATLPTR